MRTEHMNITSKGQVTIPRAMRKKFGIHPNTKVNFIEKDGELIIKKALPENGGNPFAALIGSASVNAELSTEDIMKLTRGEEELWD